MLWLPNVKELCVVQMYTFSGIFRTSCGKKQNLRFPHSVRAE